VPLALTRAAKAADGIPWPCLIVLDCGKFSIRCRVCSWVTPTFPTLPEARRSLPDPCAELLVTTRTNPTGTPWNGHRQLPADQLPR